MGKRQRPTAELVKKKGEWIVKITLPDGKANYARHGSTQKIIYDQPERVPAHLRDSIIPELMRQASHKNIMGE